MHSGRAALAAGLRRSASSRIKLVRAAAAPLSRSVLLNEPVAILHSRARPMATAAAAAAPTAPPITHEQAKHRFTATLPDGAVAELTYQLITNSEKSSSSNEIIMEMDHTLVPPSARGMGLAGKLADCAFDFARAGGYAVKPTCSYIRDTYLPKLMKSGGSIDSGGKQAGWSIDLASGLALPPRGA